MEQPRRLVKLGGALLRTRDDEPSVPEEWRATLLHKYLDNASRAALAQSSKAALQLMPSAIVTLHVRGDVDAEAAPAALVSSVRAARLAMTRTDKPTRIVIRQTGPVQPEFQHVADAARGAPDDRKAAAHHHQPPAGPHPSPASEPRIHMSAGG